MQILYLVAIFATLAEGSTSTVHPEVKSIILSDKAYGYNKRQVLSYDLHLYAGMLTAV
jgi:hypothetical protein